MRNNYLKMLSDLNSGLTVMGELIEKAIYSSVSILESQSVFSLMEARGLEEKINRQEKEIESLCVQIILKQQPVAKDLLAVSAALKMITDMERIGDNAYDIASIAEKLNAQKGVHLHSIIEMAHATAKMVTDSIAAFIKQDVEAAKAIIMRDDVIDDLFHRVKDELVLLIADVPGAAGPQIELLMIAKYFERIGDHAVNIAEWVIYSITGEGKDITNS